MAAKLRLAIKILVFLNFCRPFSFQKVRSGGKNFATPFRPPGSTLQLRNSNTAPQKVHSQSSNHPDTVGGRWPRTIGGTTTTATLPAYRERREIGRTSDSVKEKAVASYITSHFQTKSKNDASFSSKPDPSISSTGNLRGSLPSCNMGQLPPPSYPSPSPGNSPPIAMVAPVVSSTAQATATE